MEPLQLDTEGRIRALHDAGDLNVAITLVVRTYSSELKKYLHTKLRTEALADEAYLMFSEKLWRTFKGFAWGCPLRAWLFLLASSVANDLIGQAALRREVPHAPDSEPFAEQEAMLRSTTAPFMQTSNKMRMRALRAHLSERDQTLLILRLGQELSFNEIAVAMGVVAPGVDKVALEVAAAQMRGEYVATRSRLRKLAVDAGVIAG